MLAMYAIFMALFEKVDVAAVLLKVLGLSNLAA